MNAPFSPEAVQFTLSPRLQLLHQSSARYMFTNFLDTLSKLGRLWPSLRLQYFLTPFHLPSARTTRGTLVNSKWMRVYLVSVSISATWGMFVRRMILYATFIASMVIKQQNFFFFYGYVHWTAFPYWFSTSSFFPFLFVFFQTFQNLSHKYICIFWAEFLACVFGFYFDIVIGQRRA